jgi:RNA polymerase sigma-70 factor, ECF subfamily
MAIVASAPVADAVLLANVRDGDEQAFRSLVTRHQSRVVAVARRMTGDDIEAEDIAQESFLRLWRSAATLEVNDKGVGGWLYRVASNLALDRIRARKPQQPDALEMLTVPADQGKALHDAQVAARVDQALQALPERQRLALVLCHYEGLDIASAGSIIGVSVEAVESLLARSRRALKQALATEWRGLLPEPDDAG